VQFEPLGRELRDSQQLDAISQLLGITQIRQIERVDALPRDVVPVDARSKRQVRQDCQLLREAISEGRNPESLPLAFSHGAAAVAVPHRDSVLHGKVLAPRSYTGILRIGSTLNGETGFEMPLNTVRVPKSVDDARAVVRTVLNAGADYVIFYDGALPLDYYKAGIDEAHKMGKPAFVRAYGPGIFPAQAAMLGGSVRVGLEDSLYIGRGKLASSNAEQVRKIRTILTELGHEIATPAEARAMLGLKGGDLVGF